MTKADENKTRGNIIEIIDIFSMGNIQLILVTSRATQLFLFDQGMRVKKDLKVKSRLLTLILA